MNAERLPLIRMAPLRPCHSHRRGNLTSISWYCYAVYLGDGSVHSHCPQQDRLTQQYRAQFDTHADGDDALKRDLDMVRKIQPQLQKTAIEILLRASLGRNHPQGEAGLIDDAGHMSEILMLSGLVLPKPKG